jgi:hypothetical protein
LRQQRHTHILAHFCGTSCDRWEDLTLTLTPWTNKSSHIFDNSEDSRLRFFTKINFFSNIAECDFLWGCYDDSAVNICFF